MKLELKEMSLFDVNKNNPDPYVLAHCISSDFGMGAGIVVMFNKLYNMKIKLRAKYITRVHKWDGKGYVIPEKVKGVDGDNTKIVYNMITKMYVHEKPTYYTLRKALEDLRRHMLDAGHKKLAIPLIGCGIDGLSWEVVEQEIKTVFHWSDVEILVCYLEKDRHILEKPRTYNPAMAEIEQESYCTRNATLYFAFPRRCFRCKQDIYAHGKTPEGYDSRGYSVEEAASRHVTGCPHCGQTFCD